KLHESARCWLFSPMARRANARHARRSSRCKSENSVRKSSIVSPPARYSSIDSTEWTNNGVFVGPIMIQDFPPDPPPDCNEGASHNEPMGRRNVPREAPGD